MNAFAPLAALLLMCVPAHAFRDPAIDIRATYGDALEQLTSSRQFHYATRLYRITGDKGLIRPILEAVPVLAQELERGYADLPDSRAIDRYVFRSFSAQALTPEGALRRHCLLEFGEAIFAGFEVLRPMALLQQLGLKSARHDEMVKTLRGAGLREAYLHPDVIRAWPGQVTNWVLWLQQLGVEDFRAEYQRVFQLAFPHPERLERGEYIAYLYGLTHFAIAQSHYFERRIRRADFPWVFSHLEKNLERILREAKPDVLAEVGVTFLLANEPDHPAVKKCREKVAAQFHRGAGMIPSTHGSLDLSRGEHRNVMAVLLFEMDSDLFPGPRLGDHAKWRRQIPPGVVPR